LYRNFKVVAEKKVPKPSQMTEIFICEIICKIGDVCGCFSLINSRSYVQKKDFEKRLKFIIFNQWIESFEEYGCV